MSKTIYTSKFGADSMGGVWLPMHITHRDGSFFEWKPLVDTGSAFTLISRSVLRKAGYDDKFLAGCAYDGEEPLTANAAKMRLKYFVMKRVRLCGAGVDGVTVHFSPTGETHNLLGSNLLGLFNIKINRDTKTFEISRTTWLPPSRPPGTRGNILEVSAE